MAGGGDAVNRTYTDGVQVCYQIHIASSAFKSSPSKMCVLLYIFLSSISAVTVCGNLLVIISIIYFKQLHTPTNSLILSLAVADLLVGFVVFPLNMKYSANLCSYDSNMLCKVRESVDVTLSTVSILNLCCISIDRYYAVCQPLTYRTKINVHVVLIMIVVTWCTAVLVAVGFLVAGLNLEKCQENCFLVILLSGALGTIFAFYLPVVIMVSIYLKIFLVAQKQARRLQNTNCHNMNSRANARKAEGKATRTLAVVMGVFLLCWLPFFLCFSSQLVDTVMVPYQVFDTLNWLALFNSMLNPFIYAFFYSWFRSAFKLILTGKIIRSDFSNSKLF